MALDAKVKFASMHPLAAELFSEFEEQYMPWAYRTERHLKSILAGLIAHVYWLRFLHRKIFCAYRPPRRRRDDLRTMRRLLQDYHGAEIGRYSYGACMVPGLLPLGTSVGNYCSIAEGLRVFRRNLPLKHLSQHPYFYNKNLGLLKKDAIDEILDNRLHIGHDV